MHAAPKTPRPLALVAAAAACVSMSRGVFAQADGKPFDLQVRSESYVRFFQRAILPGPGGAVQSSDTLAPVCEYVSLRAAGLDSPLTDGALDTELSAWADYTFGAVGPERQASFDLSAANVRQRIGPGYVRLGRQVFVGGASRFAQFDGVSAGVLGPSGTSADAYAGLTVLPQWAERPGYYQLGSAAHTLLRSPDALPPPNRAGSWMGGGRVQYVRDPLGGLGVSFHEQRENGELGRRDFGVDVHLTPIPAVTISALGVLDVDSRELADGRAWVDAFPSDKLSVTLECLRTDPALFLSRQSILGVFGVDPFTELGGDIRYRPVKAALVGASGYVEHFTTDRTGARVSAHSELTLRGIFARLELGRVLDPADGYYSGRASLGWTPADPVVFTIEHYTYLYDRAIRGTSASTVEAASAEWTVAPALRLLLGGSLVRSPYAAFDAQTLLRATFYVDSPPRGGAR